MTNHKKMELLGFSEVARRLDMREETQFVPEEWERTQRSYPKDGPEFLTARFIEEAARYLGLEKPMVRAFLVSAKALRGREEVSRLAWHCSEILFGDGAADIRPKWLIPSLKEHAGMFPALVLLSGLPGLRGIYARKNIPEKVATDTLADLPMCRRVYKKENGRWGLGQLNWMVLHFKGAIFRLGRLQLMPERFSGPVEVLRSRRNGKVILLAREGGIFRADGFLDGANGVKDEKDRWTARFRREGSVLRGNPIAPAGYASREEVALPAEEWEICLTGNDPILEIHIPAEQPLAAEACRASFAQAQEFFPRHCPEVSFKAFACAAWLLDPTFARILPPISNIVAFQGLFHLYPAWGDERGAFYRVFGDAGQDLAAAPRDTTLRRAIVELYASGGRLIGGGGGVLPLASEVKGAIN